MVLAAVESLLEGEDPVLGPARLEGRQDKILVVAVAIPATLGLREDQVDQVEDLVDRVHRQVVAVGADRQVDRPVGLAEDRRVDLQEVVDQAVALDPILVISIG